MSVAAYLRRFRVSLPTIVDFDRSFEKQCGVPTVSLNAIMQVRIITADGQMTRDNPRDLEKAAERALEGASWNVEPSDIPAALRRTWLAVEFGNYPAAAKSLKKNLKSRKAGTKAAAEKLQAYVQQQLDKQMQSAAADLDGGRKWQAYKTYASIQQTFKGYEIPDEVAQRVKTLSVDESVKVERTALKRFQSAKQKVLSAKSAASRKRGLGRLKKIVADSPETEAASQAKVLLEGLSGSTAP